MAQGLREVALLPDPVGEVTGMWLRPNGLQVGRMRIPLGVIGFHLRIPSQCDGGCGRTLPEIRQCRYLERRQ